MSIDRKRITKRKAGRKQGEASLGRRSFVGLATTGAALTLAAPWIVGSRKAAAAQRIVATDVGGPYTPAYNEAYYQAFNEANAGKVEVVNVAIGSNPVAECIQMVETGNYLWDLVNVGAYAELLLREKGYLEELNVDDDPHVSEIPDRFKTSCMIGLDSYATVLAYRSDVYPAGKKQPTGGWKDIWDAETFKGRRSLRKAPFDTIEQALMADGVAKEDVYPCDVDRAFGSLEKIKPEVNVWWSSGAQTSQLLTSGEVSMCPTWNGRAQAAKDGGAPVDISWAQGLITWGGWVVLRDNPKIEACRELIKFAARADRQALITKHMAYGPCNPGAYEHIDPARAQALPTAPDNLAQMLNINDEFWSGNRAGIKRRFDEWLLT